MSHASSSHRAPESDPPRGSNPERQLPALSETAALRRGSSQNTWGFREERDEEPAGPTFYTLSPPHPPQQLEGDPFSLQTNAAHLLAVGFVVLFLFPCTRARFYVTVKNR